MVRYYKITIVAGIGGSLCYVPSIVFLSYYFRRRLGIATALPSLGSSVSQLIMAPLCAYLLETYGLPGTFLIFGGVSLHILISAALFFPVSEEQLKLAEDEYQAEVKAKLEAMGKSKGDKENEIENDSEKETTNEELLQGPENDFKKSQLSLAEIDINASITSLPGSSKNAKRPDTLQVAKRLLRDPMLWIMMPVFSVGVMSSISVLRYAPSYVINEHNLTIRDVSLFLALSGIPGIVVRLCVGFTADLDCVKFKFQRYRLWVVGLFLIILIDILLLLMKSYHEFMFVFMLMGTSGGFFQLLASVTTFDLLGRENYAIGFGILSMASGLMFMFDSMVVGKWYTPHGIRKRLKSA